MDEFETVDLNTEKNFVSGGIVDSFTVLMLVNRMEKEFQVKIELEDDLATHLDSLEKIEALISSSKKK